MKGIVLAGGSGTRLSPLTNAVCKQLLPIFDVPMIYHPICTLMKMGIYEILIISTPNDTPIIAELIGDGSAWGIKIEYKVQERPDGIAQAFLLGENFINNQNVALVLGDNIFIGPIPFGATGMPPASLAPTIFAYKVSDPERYGVLEIGSDGAPISIEEKPAAPRSQWAVTGLYIYPPDVVEIAKSLTPSARGELEITEINNAYLSDGRLEAMFLDASFAWLDTGTCDSLFEATQFIKAIERGNGIKAACPEEIALRHGWVTLAEVGVRVEDLSGSPYGAYLSGLATQGLS